MRPTPSELLRGDSRGICRCCLGAAQNRLFLPRPQRRRALDAPHLGFSPEGKEFRERFTLMLTLLAPELFKGENLKAYNNLKSIMVKDILDVRKETK